MNENSLPEQEEDLASEKKSKLGIKFFFVYLIIYAGFIAIGVFNYDLLAIEVYRGINLAIFYGGGLILLAVLMGVIYNYLCSKYESELNPK